MGASSKPQRIQATTIVDDQRKCAHEPNLSKRDDFKILTLESWSIMDQHLQQSPSIWCSGFSHHPEVQKKKKEMYELQYEAIAIRVQKCPVQVLYCPAIPAGVIWSSFLR